MNSERNPQPSSQSSDILGGPDRSDREDELAGPGASGPDTFGGPDPGPEDVLAGSGAEGPDTLGGPDPGEGPEDELRRGA
jgi:hypothetical protein